MTRRQRTISITKRQEAIVFLKRQALSAYNDGNIATVRHLSGVALDKAVKDGTVGLKLDDFLWAFVFMSFFGGNWETSLLIEQAYEKFRVAEKSPTDVVENNNDDVKPNSPVSKKTHANNQPCIPLLSFIFDFLKSDWSRLDEHYHALIEIDTTKISDYNESYIELLLTKVIELFWDKNHNSDKWETLSEKWSHYKTVKYLYSRLKVQTFVLYSLEPEETENIINEEFTLKDNPVNHLLAKAWFYIFTEKWMDLDNLIFEMKKYISFESEYTLSFQGLINSKRTPGENATEPLHKTPNGEISTDYLENMPEILRCQRIQTTRPIALFYSQLEVYFDTKIAELKEEPYGKGHIRDNLMSVNTLLRLEALRLWDFKMYQKARKQRKDLLFEIGLYRNRSGKYAGEYTALINAIILFIIEIKNHKINELNELKKAHYLLEISPYVESYIEEIAETIIKVFPSQYSSALAIFETAEDSIPAVYLEDIAHWSVKVFNHFSLNSYNFKVKCFNFWDNILKYHEIPANIWTILEPAFKEIFNNPEYWQSSKDVLILALQKAPIETAVQWADCMAKMEISNNHIEQTQYKILINGTVNAKELKRIADNYLYDRTNSENDDLEKKAFWHYEKQLLDSFNGLQTGHEYIHNYLINQLIEKCKSIQSNSKESSSNLEIPYPDFACVDWTACQSGLLIDVIDLIEDTIYQSSNLTYSDIGELLLPVSNIVRTASIEVVERIVVLVRKIIENQPSTYEFSPDDPFSNLAVEYDAKKDIDIDFAIISTIARFYHIIAGQERVFFRKWAVQESYTTSLSNLGILSGLLLRIYLNSKYEDDKMSSYEALTVIYGRVQQGDGLASVLCNLSVILQAEDANNRLSPEHKLTKLFKRFIQISYKYPDPEVRENCASLTMAVTESGVSIDKKIIATLKNDVRARVRKFFN